jgi:hypothetical protein
MKALTRHGKGDMRFESVSQDRASARRHYQGHSLRHCGSDLHIFDGVIPGMERGRRPLTGADVDRDVRGWERASDRAPAWIEFKDAHKRAKRAPRARA